MREISLGSAPGVQRIAGALALTAIILTQRHAAATTTRCYLSSTSVTLDILAPDPNDPNGEPKPKDKPLVTVGLLLRPGETRFLEGRMSARSNTTGTVEQQLWIQCVNIDSGDRGERVVASRNHEGTDWKIGDGYVRDDSGHLVLTTAVHYFLTAPADASGPQAYSCTLCGAANDTLPGSRLFALRSVKDSEQQEIAGTWLQVVDENKRGAQWVDMKSSVTPESNCNPKDLYDRCQPQTFLSDDADGQCLYIFPNTSPSSQRILEMKASKSDLLPVWQPGGTMTVHTDFELTTCPKKYTKRDPSTRVCQKWKVSSSCNQENNLILSQAKELKENETGADVSFRLEVAEIDSTGTFVNCAGPDDVPESPGWTFSPAPGAGTSGGNYRRERITDGAHHKKVHRSLTRRTSNNPECSRVLVRVFVAAISGQPIKIDTARVSGNGRVRSMFTNGIVWLDSTHDRDPVHPNSSLGRSVRPTPMSGASPGAGSSPRCVQPTNPERLPGLNLSPTVISFDSVPLGDIRRRTLTIENASGFDVTVEFPGSTSGPFTWQPFKETIPHGESRNRVFEFRPAGQGIAQRTVTIRSNGPCSPHLVKLTGKGLGGVDPL